MQTVENAGLILKKSWTVRLSVFATGLEVVGLVWPVVQPHVEVLVSPHIFHVIAAVCVAAIPLARVIKQSSLQ